MTPPPIAIDPATVARLVAALRDPSNAEAARTFPRDAAYTRQPGLYAWWADTEGVETLTAHLQMALPPLIYAGLAGATHWPSGRPSNTTLVSRVRTLHLKGNIRGSTFRQTLAALLHEPLELHVVGPNRLTPESEQRLSAWMAEHLRVAVQPYLDRDTLGTMEQAILTQLDPPLNIKGLLLSPLRRAIAERRHWLSHPR